MPTRGPRGGDPRGEAPDENGELLDFEDDAPLDVQDTDDGGALVDLGEEGARPVDNGDFFANLVHALDPIQLHAIESDLIDKVEQDAEARRKRDEQQADALRRTGFSDEAPGGATFTGASKVVHPMLGKASIEFGARTIKELFPADGPVKGKAVGEPTAAKVDRAARKARHLNWQLTEQMPEFRSTLEALLSQVPMGGAQYLKTYYDKQLRRPAVEAVWIDQVLLPYAAANFYSARRRTVVLKLTEQEYLRRVESGTYIDADLTPSGVEPDQTKSERAADRVEGKSQSAYNEDGLRQLYECYVWLALDEDPYGLPGFTLRPYLVTLDCTTRRCVGFYRNWDPEISERRAVVEELDWITEWPFIPWRGYPLGIFHLIGGLSVSATGALRALLDSAHLNNAGAGVKLKGLLRGGQSIDPSVTQIQELEGHVNADDIRKLYMPLMFNPPSTVLFELLGFLTEQGEGMVRVALEEVPDVGANAPVGTTLARIEQGLQVFSAIHARLHVAMARTLKIIHRINRDTLSAPAIMEETGELLALPEDYRGPMDAVPVSDPNIFSELQRYGQVQAIAQRAAGNPLYDQAKVEQRILATLKIPDADELLVNPPDPDPEDPVTENVRMALGKPATAFPNQDHAAHLVVLCQFMLDPNLGGGQLIGPQFVPLAVQHGKEHLVFLYAKLMADTVERAADGAKLSELAKRTNDPKVESALARAFAAASRYVHEEQVNLFKQAADVFNRAIEFIQKLQQQSMPGDPNQAAMVAARAAQAEVERKAKADQVDAQLKAGDQKIRAATEGAKQQREDARTRVDLQDAAVRAGLERQKLAQDAEAEQLRADIEQLKQNVILTANREDNATAMRIALLELAGDAASNRARLNAKVSTGTGLGRGPTPSKG